MVKSANRHSVTPSTRGAWGGRPARAQKEAAGKWHKAIRSCAFDRLGALGLTDVELEAVLTCLTEEHGMKRFFCRLSVGSALPSPEDVAFSMAFELRLSGVRPASCLPAEEPGIIRSMADSFLRSWPLATAATRPCDEGIDVDLADVRQSQRCYFHTFDDPKSGDIVRVLFGDETRYVDYMSARSERNHCDVRLDRHHVEGGFFRVGNDYYLLASDGLVLDAAEVWKRSLVTACQHRRLHHECGLFRGEDESFFQRALNEEESFMRIVWHNIVGGSTNYSQIWSK